MALTLIYKVTRDNIADDRTVRVYWNSEVREYVCKLFINMRHYESADYFTTDKEDAISTANSMAKGLITR